MVVVVAPLVDPALDEVVEPVVILVRVLRHIDVAVLDMLNVFSQNHLYMASNMIIRCCV